MSTPPGPGLHLGVQPPAKEIARYETATGNWYIMVEGQWVSLDHLIDSLVEMRTILRQQFQKKGKAP